MVEQVDGISEKRRESSSGNEDATYESVGDRGSVESGTRRRPVVVERVAIELKDLRSSSYSTSSHDLVVLS